MASIERFEDIEAWKKARELAKEIYAISTNEGPFAQDFQTQSSTGCGQRRTHHR